MAAPHLILLGERRDEVPAHPAIDAALTMARSQPGVDLTWTWLRTDAVGADARAILAKAHGLWCVPASPYASMQGALEAIRVARESRLPFMGTCGGFQHAVIEYARHVLKIREADHAETSPEATVPIIALLACSLVEETAPISLVRHTRIHAAYGCDAIEERYRCRYGVNRQFEALLEEADMQVTARDPDGEVRGIELRSHPFFVATLFQHERRALSGQLPPLVRAFVAAAIARATIPSA